MDGKRFDELLRRFATRQTRRSVLGLIGAALAGGTLLERDADAARRPPPAPTPIPTCPGQQNWSNGQCVCPSGLNRCGPDCCNDDEQRVLVDGTNNPNYSECCDNACCFGTCYGEELCCPSTNTWCEASQECCPADRPYCCGADGCCSTPCCDTGAGLACCDIVTECAIAADCAGTDSECQTRTCIDGTCGVTYTLYGVAVSDQIVGDCQSNVCNGSGGVVTIADDSDVPTSQNDCTSVSCSGGIPSTTYLPVDTPCASNGGSICDGSGQCLACIPGNTKSCYTGPAGTEGVGICRAGTQTCRDDGSGFNTCLGQVTPSLERCNGLDDDCDGAVDEGIAGIGGPCTTGLPGICAQGTLQCQGGMTRCAPLVLPFTRSETCNGLDDDCDGLVDEGACPSPMECRSGDSGYGCCFPSGVSASNCDQCCSGECIPLLNVCT